MEKGRRGVREMKFGGVDREGLAVRSGHRIRGRDETRREPKSRRECREENAEDRRERIENNMQKRPQLASPSISS